jgi:hypothetical protein
MQLVTETGILFPSDAVREATARQPDLIVLDFECDGETTCVAEVAFPP